MNPQAEPASHLLLLLPLPPCADEEGIRRHSTAMNAGGAVQLFAGMLTQRPWEEVTRKEVRREGRGGCVGYSCCCAALHTASH